MFSVSSMENDRKYIVCGRGQRNYNNEGNKVARRVVATRLARYMDEKLGRIAKTKLIDSTTRKLLRMEMVFVTIAKDNRSWVTLSNADARSKVAHMFRDASLQTRRCKDKKFMPSRANAFTISPHSHDTSSAPSVFSTEDETSVLRDLDAGFNNKIVSRDTTPTIVACPEETSAYQKKQVPEVIKCVDIQRLHASSQSDCRDAMEHSFVEVELLRFKATCSTLVTHLTLDELVDDFVGSPNVAYLGDHLERKLGRIPSLQYDDDSCTLSAIEDIEDLCMLVASFSEFEADQELFPSFHF